MHVEIGGEQTAGETVAQADRRRAGRQTQVSPELIPLLRGEFEGDLPPEEAPSVPVLRGAIRRQWTIAWAVIAVCAVIGVAFRFVP